MKTLLCLLPALLVFPVATTAQIDTVETLPQATADRAKESSAGKIAAIAPPLVALSWGAASLMSSEVRQVDFDIRNGIKENSAFVRHHVDDWVQYSPGVAAYVLKLSGVESRSNYLDMTLMYALSMGLEAGAVRTVKNMRLRHRPDTGASNSFPSGHTATAFVAAEMLHQEFKDRSIWISVGGYTVASLVGVSRIFNDRHWLSDVLAGAGIGILSTKAVYWLYPLVKEWAGSAIRAGGYLGTAPGNESERLVYFRLSAEF